MTQITTEITTEQFLEDLFGDPDADIIFNTNGKSWKDSPQPYHQAQPTLQSYNQNLADIYFIPNAGGTKNDDITNINSLFIDWDAGRGTNKQYYSLDIVNQKKQVFLHKLSLFSLSPSYVVETRNGYHVYWLLFPGCTSDEFRSLQKSLIRHFDSDPAIHNPNRVMRLPGYSACKSGQYEPFLVSIVEYNSVRYTVDLFISHFNSLLSPSTQETDTDTDSDVDSNSISSTEVRFGAHNNILALKDNTRNIIVGTKRQTSDTEPSVQFNTMIEVIHYLCKQNIAEYTQEDNYEKVKETGIIVKCPFHEDKSPSASIYYHDEDDYCYFKCHSSNCSFGSGTLIKYVQTKEDISEGQAVAKLMEHYEIVISDEWKEEETKKYTHNIETINQCRDWKDDYPDLYRCIHRIQGDLISKLTFAKDNLHLRTTVGKSIFFCSLREFERIYKQNPYLDCQGRQNERVDRYCLLGLMEKIDKNDIPCSLYENMEETREKKRYQFRIQCYTFPEYTPACLQQADNMARMVKMRGIKLNSISKNSVRDVFGESVARKVYPQVEDIKPTESGLSFMRTVENVLTEEISINGYATISVVKERLLGPATWKNIQDRRIKEHLPGLLETHQLIEVTANKILKEKYNIESVGYPKIIIRQPEESNE